jgi:hypothetical protein
VHYALDAGTLGFVQNDPRALDIGCRVGARAVHDGGHALHCGPHALGGAHVALHDLNGQSTDACRARPSPNAGANGSRIQLVQHFDNPAADEPSGAGNQRATRHQLPILRQASYHGMAMRVRLE